MLDYPRIVEEIQSALGSAVPPDWDLLRDTAAEYAAACDEVNVRLVECAGLLKKGLRSEALQAAEQEPNVLDSVGILDFPELPEWHKALTEQGIVLPPAIKNDIAGDLNTAYFSATPITGLMRSHRLLALARAPLSQRIGVMRQIRDLDFDNPLWDQDLRVYESARMREIPKELATASTAKDAKRVEALAWELETPGWLSTPPADLVKRTRKMLRALAAESAATELTEIEKELSNAHSALDEDAGVSLKERWEKLIETAQLSQNDPLMARAAPALNWVDRFMQQRTRQNEYAAALAHLEESLERDADRRTLERAYQTIGRLDAELPEVLERRYVERIRSLDAADKRKFILMLSGVVGALAITAGIALWVILRSHHENQVASSTAALRKLVDAGSIVEARKYADSITSQSKPIAERPVFVEQVARLEGLESDEQNRLAQLNALLTRLEALDENSADRVALSEAEKLAKTDSEIAKVGAIRSRVRAADLARQKVTDTNFEQRFRELLDQTTAIERELEKGQTAQAAAFSELKQSITALRDQNLPASAALVAQLNPLQEKVAVLSRVNDDLLNLERSLESMDLKIGNPSEFAKGLTEISNGHATMAGFKLVAQEANLWGAAQAWNAATQEMRAQNLAALSPKEATALLAKADALVMDHPAIAEPPSFSQKRGLLEGLSRRTNSEGQLQIDLLRRSFEGRIMTGLWLVKGRRFSPKSIEERFYTSGNPIPPGGNTEPRITIEPVNSLDLSLGKTLRLEMEGLVAKPAPQGQLSKDVIEILDKGKNADWDASVLEVLSLLLSSKYEDLDPLLRFITFSRVLEVGKDGSHAIKVSFEPIWQIVQEANVDLSANWLIWNEKQAASSRAEAETSFRAIIARFPDAKKQFAEQLQQDRLPLERTPQWIGWIRPSKKKLILDFGRNKEIDGSLFMIRPATTNADDKATWVMIGTTKAGISTFDPRAELLAGRPVFVVPDANAK